MTVIKELKVCYDIVLWISANQAIKSFGRGNKYNFCQSKILILIQQAKYQWLYIHLTSQSCSDVWKWRIYSCMLGISTWMFMQTGSPAWSGVWSLSTCIQLPIWHNLTRCVWFVNPHARAVRYLQFPTQLEESKQVSLFGRHDASRWAACRTTLQFTTMMLFNCDLTPYTCTINRKRASNKFRSQSNVEKDDVSECE